MEIIVHIGDVGIRVHEAEVAGIAEAEVAVPDQQPFAASGLDDAFAPIGLMMIGAGAACLVAARRTLASD